MLLTFDEKVTGFDYTVYEDPDGGDFCYCDIQAWTSLWDQWFAKGKGKLSAAVTTGADGMPVIAVYVPNDGSENICIGKYDPAAEDPIEKDVNLRGPVTVLPAFVSGILFTPCGSGPGCFSRLVAFDPKEGRMARLGRARRLISGFLPYQLLHRERDQHNVLMLWSGIFS